MSDNWEKRVEAKLDNVTENLSDMKVMFVKQQGLYEKQQFILDEHTKRSDNLELLYKELKENDIEPIKEHVIQVKGVFAFLTSLGKLTGSIAVLGAIAKFAAKFIK